MTTKSTAEHTRREWQDILDLANHNKSLALWLDARDRAFNAGFSTEGYTSAIRKEYRALMLYCDGAVQPDRSAHERKV